MNIRSLTNANKYRCSLFKGAKYDNDDDDTKIVAAEARYYTMLSCYRSAREKILFFF